MNDSLLDVLKAIAKDTLPYEATVPFLEVQSRAAVLALFRGQSFLDSEVLLILRSKHLSVHAGEVAFPGGGMEMLDMSNPVQTALRECFEEVGIPASAVQALGVLPMLPTLSGKALVDPVIAIHEAPAETGLILDGHEVSAAEWVSVRALKETRKLELRTVPSGEFAFPYFQWKEEKMWGLTAMIFDLILRRYDRLF
ncbi:MAG: CoA pyrophosphatase [Bdellovibrionales bacterium]|nr:CoA pyrophosphatase [Oligoflexia bacterium]